MSPLSSQGSSWYRAIVSLGLSLTIFVVLRLVTVGQTDRQTELVSQKAALELNHVTDLLRQTGQGPLFTVMIPTSDLVSLLKVIQSDEDGEAS